MRRSKPRSRLKIVADMLYVAEERSKKTHIMYGANLSYRLTERYLRDVVEAGLLQYSDGEYVVTEKGKEFLRGFRDYTEHQKEIRGQVEEANDKRMKLEKMCFNE